MYFGSNCNSDEQLNAVVAAAVRKRKILTIMYIRRKRQQAEKSWWVRPIFQNRPYQGAHEHLIAELRKTDPKKYFNYLRVSPQKFDELLTLVAPKIEKQSTNYREAISSCARLELTVRYLASGDSMTSISYAFRIGVTTVSTIISETCQALWDVLKDVALLTAPTHQDWLRIADEFNLKWNFPHCIAAIDGKHVVIEAPPNAGSMFYNYKGSHSLVLMALCDANYCFTVVDIGAPGRQSDGGIFRQSAIGLAIENNTLDIPAPAQIPDGPTVPYVIVADEAFQLTTNMMRPYPQRFGLDDTKKIFNYRLSRPRRMIENCFGILAARWRIFRRPIISSLETAEKIIQATIVLHNFIKKGENYLPSHMRTYCPPGFVDSDNAAGEWRQHAQNNTGLLDIQNVGSHTHSINAAAVRDSLAEYFAGNGVVDWQWERAANNDF